MPKARTIRIFLASSKELGIYSPYFNYGEFAIIKSQAGLNNYKIIVSRKNRPVRPNRPPDSETKNLRN